MLEFMGRHPFLTFLLAWMLYEAFARLCEVFKRK